jgi:lycopene beta-cyclase
MTYGDLLALFLVSPILVLALLTLRDRHLHKEPPSSLRGSPFPVVLPVLTLVAAVYTTPWDNHLIAEGVWSYGTARISGIAFARVPIEELAFFLLQSFLVGLWFLWLVHRVPGRTLRRASAHGRAARWLSAGTSAVIWIGSLAVLISGWRPGVYIGWEVVWALPPLILQLSVGADILWAQRTLVCATLLPVLLYLSAVDTLAIHQRIWTIDPHQSLDVLVGGQLPLEELLFFSLTSALVVFGLVLGVADDSRHRLSRAWQAAQRLNVLQPHEHTSASNG